MREEICQTGRRGRLHGRLWFAQSDPCGVVIVVHGLGDHSGRYDRVAARLAEQGWALFAFDLPGHGKSPGARGRVDSFDGLMSDIASARQTVETVFAQTPQVLLGNSMGGNLALNYVLHREKTEPVSSGLAGLVLAAPMILPPSPPPRPHIFAAWMTGHLFPWITIERPLDPSALTSDPEQAELIAEDPLAHARITIYLATQLLSQGRWALDHARDVDVPTLVMHGQQDELIDRSACEHLAIRIGPQAELRTWPKLRHDLFREVKRADIVDHLCRWLEQRVD